MCVLDTVVPLSCYVLQVPFSMFWEQGLSAEMCAANASLTGRWHPSHCHSSWQTCLQTVNQAPAFTVTGVDFAGPVTLKRGHTRRPVYIKAYIAVFICFKTCSTHLEVVSDLTTAAFLASMRRFVSRRGIPMTLYSDNGSNFKGARNSLEELYWFLEQEHSNPIIHHQLLEERLTWKMIPQWAPHFGGL